MSFEPDKDPSLDGLADPQDPVPHAHDPREARAIDPLGPHDPRAIPSADDFAIEDDHLAQTVEVEVAQLGALASGAEAPRDRDKDRPSRKERVRPKITLRIPDDEVSRPEPSHTSTTAIPPVAEAVDRVTARELEVDIDGTPATGVPQVEPGARTSPLPPRADSEDIEVSIPSTPFISVDSVDADPSEPGPFDLSASPVPVAQVMPVAPVMPSPAVAPAPPLPLVQTPAAPPAARIVVPSPSDIAGLAGNEGEPREFEALREGPFAEEDDESGWTPWQPTAIDLREAAASSRVDLDSSAIEEIEASPLSEEPDLIPVDSDDDPLPASNPPEIEPEDVLVEEAAAPPPVRPRAPSVPGLPPMRPQYVTPTSIGMESIPPDPLSGPSTAPVPPRPPPAPVNSAPQLHQVLAEGGPRVGSPQASTAPAERPAASAPASAPSSDPSNSFSSVESKTEAKKRAKPWWEELFNDDYLRTVGAIKDSEIDAEVSFIEDSLGVAKGATVLDLACGTGRHAIELGRRGYQVVGFDLSLAMLARASDEAQERGQKLNFVQGDMREMTFEDAFDGIYCWQTSFGFFEEEKNTAVIGRVHRALRKGGQFLLDVVNRDYVAREAPSLVWFEGDGCICMDEMQMDFITSRLRVKRTMMIDDGRSKEIEYSVRAYSLHELGKMLNDAGFRVAEVTGKIQTPGVFFGCESPRIVILAEKR
jgi:SAM-dependent methyltransferase